MSSSMTYDLITAIAMSISIVVMFLAILQTRHLLKRLKYSRYERSWQILLGLMVISLLGYLFPLLKMTPDTVEQVMLVVSLVFIIGGLFVFLVVRTGRRTITDLFETAVSKQYVENIIQSMADTLIVVKLDPESRIKTVNKATLNLLGYSETEMVGQPISMILGEKFDRLKASVNLESGFFISEEEVEYQTKDEEPITVLWSVSPVQDLSGKHDGFIIVGKDIRKMKEAQLALEESERRYRGLAEELDQSNKLKDLLLDIITHDIKNPVGVIQTAAYMESTKLPDNEALELITNSSERLAQVMENATLLSRVAMNETIDKRLMSVSKLLKDVVETFKPTFEEAGMTIDNEVEQLTALANPVIEEIFTNYLSNAAKYASAGKRLLITQDHNDEMVTLSFVDFGETIPENQREAVFTRSIQLEKGKKRGRGLGLSIVKYIAESLGGSVGVKPNDPTGNIFYLTIPVK